MKKKVILLGIVGMLLALFAGTSAAQTAPDAVREAAIVAAQNALNTTERPSDWRWTFLASQSTTALGCGLVTGTPLPNAMSAYAFDITFTTGVYRVHVSADAEYVQLCDEKFSAAQIESTPEGTPTVPSCIVNVSAALATVYQLPSEDAAVLASVGSGSAMMAYGRSSDSTWYQVAIPNSDSLGWVSLDSITAPFACQQLPVKASVAGDSTTGSQACFLVPASTYSNVRTQPTTDSEQVGSIFEGTTWQVYARNGESTWYYIEPGWVASSVVTLQGSCNAIPVNVELVGAGTSQAVATPISPTPLAVGLTTGIPTDAVCPASFTDYMAPRIRVGQATARVVSGGIPNRLREQPNTQGSQIGQVNPGRTIDRVLNGPACVDGYVWWLVEVDGVTGWTAESSFADEDYYLEPVGGAATPQVAETPIPDEVPHMALEINGTGIAMTTTDSRVLVALSAPVDGTSTQPPQLLLYDVPEDMATDPIVPEVIESEEITALGTLPNDVFAVVTADGTLNIYDTSSTARFEGIETDADDLISALSFNSTGSIMLLPACATTDDEGTCTQGRIDLWDAVEGTVIRRQPAHTTVPTVLFSPNDQVIASVGPDGVQFWDLQTGGFLGAVASMTNSATYDITFSPDGSQLLYGTCQIDEEGTCIDGRVVTIDPNTFEATDTTFADHSDAVSAVAFSPDGDLWASASVDGSIFVYDAATNERLYTLAEEGVVPVDIAFTGAEGHTLAVLGLSLGDAPINYLTFWQLDVIE
ncbi:hypothetical protein G4Y79_00510 [Phototrophicus methaneseepsis]|uniref:SH3b domain-containing protein n=1 Tax=Phototrophicus methaneseepsis TaxID=2710758 RepID=A0A7S8E9K1_9CHLR|nr:SH3 domain-containing protein [Phototrophicus methaneseepsis]QPC82886.1 hypothetical protein G4Y79_00510 [Phototrophicus methaneseepsis]